MTIIRSRGAGSGCDDDFADIYGEKRFGGVGGCCLLVRYPNAELCCTSGRELLSRLAEGGVVCGVSCA